MASPVQRKQEEKIVPSSDSTGTTPIPTPTSLPKNDTRPKVSLKTPKLSDLVKGEKKNSEPTVSKVAQDDKPYSEEDLQNAWNEFAEKRKAYQADYQLLTQPFNRKGNDIIVHLYSIQETIFSNIRSDLTTFIRERLQNFSITVNGELIEGETKKMLYTNREKLEHLMEKNPALKELKERLGLDTDF